MENQHQPRTTYKFRSDELVTEFEGKLFDESIFVRLELFHLPIRYSSRIFKVVSKFDGLECVTECLLLKCREIDLSTPQVYTDIAHELGVSKVENLFCRLNFMHRFIHVYTKIDQYQRLTLALQCRIYTGYNSPLFWRALATKLFLSDLSSVFLFRYK